MTFFDSSALTSLEHLYKINLINSSSGFKSANLIATKSKDGISNVAIFSSVIHLGSKPPLLAFIVRPTTVQRNTYQNLKDTGVYTINHVYQDIIEEAHHTSAKYGDDISEFSMTDLEEVYRPNCLAPFVKGSPVQLKMEFKEEHHFSINKTIMIIGEIKEMYIQDDILENDGLINLSAGNVTAINGLDTYTLPKFKTRLGYQRPRTKLEQSI